MQTMHTHFGPNFGRKMDLRGHSAAVIFGLVGDFGSTLICLIRHAHRNGHFTPYSEYKHSRFWAELGRIFDQQS
jgi:hypothetical protein